jgi:6-phosphogluconolactonase
MLPLLLTIPSAGLADLYIGTYTSNEGSKGIYHSRLNLESGALSTPNLAVQAENPSFLAIHPSGKSLYAVHESTDGEVSSYSISRNKGLALLNTMRAPGWGPCHTSVDPTGKNLFTASYGGGTIACFPIKPDGSLSAPSFQFKNSGSGPDKSRQESPHLHSIYADTKSRFVYALDLGTDEILTYHFDASKGKLTPTEPRSGKAPAGGGPRHLAFHPSGRFAYANNEMLNSVTAYAIDPDSGTLKSTQTLSTLPAHGKTIRNSTAEIACHPNGKWLYVSNRGDDSIAVYSVQASGELVLSEIVSTTVKEPRGFAIDPSGRWIVVGGQNSDELVSLAIDKSTGHLKPSGNRVRINKPVCIAFSP